MNISIILNNIQDPRRNHLQKHSLETIIYIAIDGKEMIHF